MASQAHIVRIRSDLGSGAFQVTDLAPNSSQRSIYEPQGQSGYLNPQYQNDDVSDSVTANVTTAALNGIAAYVVDVVANGDDGNGITGANADDIATAFIALAAAGSSMQLADLNSAMDTVLSTSATSLTAASGTDSVGSVKNLMRIMAGEVYTVPADTAVNGGTGFKGSADGAFDADASADRGWKTIYSTGALQISCGGGVLASFAGSTFSYGGTTGAACAVYSDSGVPLT